MLGKGGHPWQRGCACVTKGGVDGKSGGVHGKGEHVW